MKFKIEDLKEHGAVMIKDENGKILLSMQRNENGYSYSINPTDRISLLSIEEGSFIIIQTEDA